MKLSRDVLSKSIISYAEVKVEANTPPTPSDPSAFFTTYNTTPFTLSDATISVPPRMAYSPELNTLVVASFSDTMFPSNAFIVSHDNGATWVLKTLPNYEKLGAVCWSPNLHMFCAIEYESYASNTRVFTSTDGDSWTSYEVLLDLHGLDICYSDVIGFCIVGMSDSGQDKFIVSQNGTSWNVNNLPQNHYTPRYDSICWSPELQLLCIAGDAMLKTSPDGINWIEHSADKGILSDYNWKGVAWSSDLHRFCAYGNPLSSNGKIATSTDGNTWTVSERGYVTQYNYILSCESIGAFVLLENGNDGTITYSIDGLNLLKANMVFKDTNFVLQHKSAMCWIPNRKELAFIGKKQGDGEGSHTYVVSTL